MPTPEHTAKADQFHTMCEQMLDHYVGAISNDMDNYARRNCRQMDATYAHNDITRMLLRRQQIAPGVLAGLVAAAILKEAARRGKK